MTDVERIYSRHWRRDYACDCGVCRLVTEQRFGRPFKASRLNAGQNNAAPACVRPHTQDIADAFSAGAAAVSGGRRPILEIVS